MLKIRLQGTKENIEWFCLSQTLLLYNYREKTNAFERSVQNIEIEKKGKYVR